VWGLSQFPGGGRIRFRSNTTELRLRYTGSRPLPTRILSGLDVYVDGEYWSSIVSSDDTEAEQVFFCGAEPRDREITIYLPLHQTISLHAVGVDREATTGPPRQFAQQAPLVLYGSSIAQGVGAGRPGMSYQAILSRSMDLDFVNLGFGGAGKAEPEVVRLIASLDACCFLFDLGKSYGNQDAAPYESMLKGIRQVHPTTPLVCITPIYSTREAYDASFRRLSSHTRSVVRQAVAGLREAGDGNVHLIDGLELLGLADSDEFLEGLHFSDLGYWRTARRLEKILRPLLE